MSYPLYKETTYPRSCSFTPEQMEDMLRGVYIGAEVHLAPPNEENSGEPPKFLRFVSREEIRDKVDAGRIVAFVKGADGKPIAKVKGVRGEIVFYVVRW